MYRTKIAGNDIAGVIYSLPIKQGEAIKAYNAVGSALVKGRPYLISYGYATGQEVKASTPATMAFPVMLGFALENTAAGAIGSFQISGYCEALVVGTGNLSAGRMLEAINSATYLTDDGATTRAATSAAVLVDAVTANENSGSPVMKTVYLIGEGHTIAGS